MTVAKGPQVTEGLCRQCGKPFRYIKINKPRVLCSGGCIFEREREQSRINSRRKYERLKARKAGHG